jgi:3-methyladenine DNA glycosylase AlkD
MQDENIISALRNLLIQHSDEKVKTGSRRYFKEDIKLYGVNTAAVNRIARQFMPEIRKHSKTEVFLLCEQLYKSDFCEEAFIAAEWSYSLHKLYDPEDFNVFERWVSLYINNWAKCDSLCNHTIGSFVEMYPEYIMKLQEWTLSENRWVRRASAVTMVLPARKGNFLNDIFVIADKLLLDEDDLVRKGYGWMLKEASRKHQNEVFAYVMRNKDKMPRTALRYAVEKMPDGIRARAMAK